MTLDDEEMLSMLRRGALAVLFSLVILTRLMPAAVAPSTGPSELQPGELGGVVLDADGKPIEGALVDAWTWHKGNETKTDYRRMMKIVLDAGYRGYVGIEYEGSRLPEPEGIRATKRLLERVRTELGSMASTG